MQLVFCAMAIVGWEVSGTTILLSNGDGLIMNLCIRGSWLLILHRARKELHDSELHDSYQC